MKIKDLTLKSSAKFSSLRPYKIEKLPEHRITKECFVNIRENDIDYSCRVSNIILDDIGDPMDYILFETPEGNIHRTTKSDVWEFIDLTKNIVGMKETVKTTEWSDSHYDNHYTLTEEDIKNGYVRLDAYKVNKVWGINKVDLTGCGFHCLKTLNRMARNKNPLEREIKALYGQIKCWAKEEGVKLDD